MKNNGYIKLWRKLRDNPIYTNSKAVHVWIECLMRATYQEKNFYKGRDKVELEPGQFFMGREEFGDSIGMSGSTAWYWIQEFESDSMIDTKRTAKGTIVTINNWEDYQKVDSTSDKTQTGDKQQKNTNKNDKKDKKDNNNIYGGKFDLEEKDNGRYEYPDGFEKIWNNYPFKRGTKKATWRKWKARRKDGISNSELLEATKNYQEHVKESGTEERYVKYGQTFFGPDEHWREYKNGNYSSLEKRKNEKDIPISNATEEDKEILGIE